MATEETMWMQRSMICVPVAQPFDKSTLESPSILQVGEL